MSTVPEGKIRNLLAPPSNRRGRDSNEFARRMLRFRTAAVFLSAVYVALLACLAVCTGAGQAIDTLIMYAFQTHTWIPALAAALLDGLVSIPALIFVSALILISILWRKRFALLMRVSLVLLVANGITQLLKVILTRPDLGIGHTLANSFPSGHVTLATSVALVLIDSIPLRWRATATAVSWLVISSVSLAVLTLGWHRLSDVLGGILIATATALLLLPAEWRRRSRYRRRGSLNAIAWISFIASNVGIALVAFWLRTDVSAPISAMQITELAVRTVPGSLLMALSTVSVLSLSALSVRAVDRLVGE